MKILITDHHSSSNRGDAAILEGMLSALKEAYPQAEFTIMSDYPDSTKVMHGIPSLYQPFSPFRMSIYNIVKMVYFLFTAWCLDFGCILPKFNSEWVNKYREADIIISKGGGFINEFYWPANLGRLWSMLFSKVLHKKVVIYSQSIGPFSRRSQIWLLKMIFNYCLDLILVRDKESFLFLRKIGIYKPTIKIVPDAAFSISFNKNHSLITYGLEGNICDMPLDPGGGDSNYFSEKMGIL